MFILIIIIIRGYIHSSKMFGCRSYNTAVGGNPIGFRRPLVTACQNKSSPTPVLYFKCGVLSRSVLNGLVICLDVISFNITNKKTSRPNRRLLSCTMSTSH